MDAHSALFWRVVIAGLGWFNPGGSYADYDYISVTSTVVPVGIDIKPGSEPNCFNNDGHGVIPVAILGSATFDVNDIDPSTVELAGLAVGARGKSNKLMAHIEDVNGDPFAVAYARIRSRCTSRLTPSRACSSVETRA